MLRFLQFMPVLADAAVSGPLDGWLNATVQLGCLGIVAFGSHHVLTKTIPSLIKQADDRSDKQQVMFLAELQRQRELHHETESASQKAFLGELSAARTDFRATISEAHGNNRALHDRLHELTIAVVSNTCPHLKGTNIPPQQPR